MTTLHPEDIEAQLAQAKKEKIELELAYLSAICDERDDTDYGRVPTNFIRQRIAAIRSVL